MAPKKTAKKTTTKKTSTKRPAEPAPEAAENKKFRVHCRAGLLTYNEVSIETKEHLEEMHKELKQKFSFNVNFSVCLEEESRLHVHVFFECLEEGRRVDCDLNYFETSKSGKPGDFQGNRGKNVAQGHYYVQCEWKTSHKCCEYDKKVIPLEKWVMDLWKQDKIEKIKEALAAYKLLKPQLEQQVNAVNNYKKNMKIKEALALRDERMKEKLENFIRIPRVEEWKKQYKTEEFRYKFLVLCGKSYMRKTGFAKSLFENPFVHKDKLDWADYDWDSHGAIIFDDVSQPDHIWKYVRTNKVLFQASSVVAVNTSATNCYKLDICVVQKPIIICTNEGLLENYVSPEYKEWIESNSVWIGIHEPIPFEDES